jgi:hypothetical protein
MPSRLHLLGWILACLALGLLLAQYSSGGLLGSFLQKLPGCF